MAYRDMLKAKAIAILNPAVEKFNQCKAEYHDALIEHNRLQKLALEVQQEISVEGLAELTEKERMDLEYGYHTNEAVQRDAQDPPTLRETLSLIRDNSK
jgi:hypothetical protein